MLFLSVSIRVHPWPGNGKLICGRGYSGAYPAGFCIIGVNLCSELFADIVAELDVSQLKSGDIAIALASGLFEVFADGGDTDETAASEFVVF